MNKQEIEAKLHNYEERLKDVANEIERLRAQLAEAEKPELRHGDFWYSKADGLNIFMKEFNPPHRDCVAISSSLITNIGATYEGEPILGNIFDLMKNWGEGFENVWESDKSIAEHRRISVGVMPDGIWLGTSGDSRTYSEEIAYKIWCKLGHALIELKRKKQ